MAQTDLDPVETDVVGSLRIVRTNAAKKTETEGESHRVKVYRISGNLIRIDVQEKENNSVRSKTE